MRIGYLGPAGTFSHSALTQYLEDTTRSAEMIPYGSISELFDRYHDQKVDEIIVPIENSIEGEVSTSIDLLTQSTTGIIKDEITIPIHHCMVAKSGVGLDDITHISSHPQPLAQCRGFISKFCPKATLVPSTSTSNAAQFVSDTSPSDENWAVIGSELLSRTYPLKIITQNIEDFSKNETQFVIISNEQSSSTGMDKTSIMFTLTDEPGSLLKVLRCFADHEINLSKITSRPRKDSLGRYLFLIDLEGHRDDETVTDVLSTIQDSVLSYRCLGSYRTEPPADD